MAGGTFVGLDIGSNLIKVAELRRTGAGVEITGIGLAPTPTEAYENSVIIDSTLLGQAVKKLLKDSGISARQVVSSVSGQSAVVVRVIEVPQMNPAELAETMKWEVERHVPFAVNEVIMDYQPIERPEGYAEGQNMEVLLAVAQQDMIDRHVEMLFAAGLKPVAIDVEPLAAGRTLLEYNPAGEPPGHTVAIVNIGASNTDIGIYRDRLPAFFRTLPMAGNNLTTAIADTLQVDLATAENYKVQSGEVILNQTPGLGPATPTWSPGDAGAAFGGAPGFMDFSNPAASQPASGTPSAASPAAPGTPAESSSGRMASGTPSGRMPFDFSTPGEVPQAPGDTDAGAFAAPTTPAAPAVDLAGQPTTPQDEAADAGFTPPDFTATPAPPAAYPPAPVPAPVSGGDSVLETRRILVFNAMAPVLTELAQELRRSLDYYRQRSADAQIHEILLVGGTANLRNLAQFLETETGVPTHVPQVLQHLPVNTKNTSMGQLDEIAALFPVSIGLGMRDLIGSAGGKRK
ncbi:MAG TPA: type IV pilus assembly protein PilM [Chthonomonadaceae bacterium]|nr:type IV pilus assembly protein PilM [Chthonomonadaceae bacterium]